MRQTVAPLFMILLLVMSGCPRKHLAPRSIVGDEALPPEIEKADLAKRLGVAPDELVHYDEAGFRFWGLRSLPNQGRKTMSIATHNSVIFFAGGGGMAVPILLEPFDLDAVRLEPTEPRTRQAKTALSLALCAAQKLWSVPLEGHTIVVEELKHVAAEEHWMGESNYVVKIRVETPNWRIPDSMLFALDIENRKLFYAVAPSGPVVPS